MLYYLGKGTEFKKEDCKEYKTIVTPFAGVWIETLVSGENNWC